MTPGLSLNTANAHTWAAAVSGTSWKRLTLAPGDVLTAEYTRGPLIPWAIRPGEGECFRFVTGAIAKAPQTPAPTLKKRIEELNTAQGFERFKWAARGRVRHSVRWKTGIKWRLKYLACAFLGLLPQDDIFFTLDHNDLMRRAGRSSRCKPGIWERAVYEYELSLIVGCSEGNFSDIEKEAKRALYYFDKTGKLPSTARGYNCNMGEETNNEVVIQEWLRVLSLYPKYLEKALSIIRSKKVSARLESFTFRATAFRAHLARRVKPTPQRHRIRRPLYARPRPPSAPLAPPVI